MSAKPYRRMYRFWLDLNRNDEAAIAEHIEHLKDKRNFTRTIRDGVRLLAELRNGSIDFLIALFPFVIEMVFDRFYAPEIREEWARIELERQKLEHEFWLLEEEKRQLAAERKQLGQGDKSNMDERLDRIERMLLEQGNQPIEHSSDPQLPPPSGPKPLQPIAGGPKQLTIPKIAAPPIDNDDDDDFDLVIQETESNGQSSRNLYNALNRFLT